MGVKKNILPLCGESEEGIREVRVLDEGGVSEGPHGDGLTHTDTEAHTHQ